MRRIAHRSYPDDVPTFLGKGNPGNFETKESDRVERGGIGDMGHSHSLKVKCRKKSHAKVGLQFAVVY